MKHLRLVPAVFVATMGFASLPQAASPASGEVSVGHPASWQFAAVIGGSPTDQGIEDICPPGPCDSYDLTVKLSEDPRTLYLRHAGNLHIKYTWTSSTPSDLDVFVYTPSGKRYGPGTPDTTSNGGPNREDLDIADPEPGVYHIRSEGSTTVEPTAADGLATLTMTAAPSFAPVLEPPPGLHDPHLTVSIAPADLYTHRFGGVTDTGGVVGISNDPTASSTPKPESAEPSIGVNWKTGAIMYQTVFDTLRARVNPNRPSDALKWDNVGSVVTTTTTNDPILHTDPATGRTWVSQLNLNARCSQIMYTDDDGASWTPSKGCGTPAGEDHQTVGSGPLPSALAGSDPIYPNAVYYCAQSLSVINDSAFCSISLDGGLTFGAGYPVFPTAAQDCVTIHGHVSVGPDGTAYVPNRKCGANQGFAISTDGISWNSMHVPATSPNDNDPAMAVDAGNRVFFAYADGDGRPRVTSSADHGTTWTAPFTLGQAFDLRNTAFPTVVAGDAGRAAISFLGTRTPGDYEAGSFGCVSPSFCPGAIWHLYTAYTYDAGRTWTTVDATPNSPVQRGCIWLRGGANACRNLLDFNGMAVDKQGQVVIAFTQGCSNLCSISADPFDNNHIRLAGIARQTCGQGLFAAYDGQLPTCATPNRGEVLGIRVATPPPAASPPPARALPNTAASAPWSWSLPVAAGGTGLLLLSLAIRRRRSTTV